MSSSVSSFRTRSKSRGAEDMVLLTDDLETTIRNLKADAAERKAHRGKAGGLLSPNTTKSKGGGFLSMSMSPAFRSPMRRATTDHSSASLPRSPSYLSDSGASTKDDAPLRRKSLGRGTKQPLSAEAAGEPGAAEAGAGTTGTTGSTGAAGAAGAGGTTGAAGVTSSRSMSIPRRKTMEEAGSTIKEDEVSVVGGASELAPGSPFSSRASSRSGGMTSTMSEGAVARLTRFDISKFSLASAPGSPQVSAAPTPAQSSVQLPPPSPEHPAAQTCFSFVTPKQIEGGVQSPLGWLVSMLCSYQAVVHERQQHLIVMRHDERVDVAEPQWKERADRPWDPPLSEQGKAHAFQVGLKLRSEGVAYHRVVCSPYLRCVETAAEVVRALLASEEEVARAERAAAAGGAGKIVGSNRHLIASQMNKGKQDVDEASEEPLRKNPPRGSSSSGRRGKHKGKKVKVRCHIEPGLCEIRAAAGLAQPPVPQSRLLLPRAQLEAMLPQESLRSVGGAAAMTPPAWPEDVMVGLKRLIGAGDSTCEQYPQENLILVTHAEAVQAEVMRCQKKATVYNIKFGGFVHLERTVYVDTEDEDDRGVSPWKLLTKSGTSGVYFSS